MSYQIDFVGHDADHVALLLDAHDGDVNAGYEEACEAGWGEEFLHLIWEEELVACFGGY